LTLCACRIGFDPTEPAGPSEPDSGIAQITTITFGERPTSMRTGVTRDATIDQSEPKLKFGADEDLSSAEFSANGEHALLRFDLSSLAPGSRIVAARLSLTRIDYGDEAPGPIEMRVLRESWTEGTNDGAPGTGASWTTRDGSAAWMTAGGSTMQTLATMMPDAPDLDVTIDPLVVQGWVDDPATNHGVLLTVGINTAHYHFHSRESNLDGRSRRPELAIDVSD
jgi:hypothetical protein